MKGGAASWILCSVSLAILGVVAFALVAVISGESEVLNLRGLASSSERAIGMAIWLGGSVALGGLGFLVGIRFRQVEGSAPGLLSAISAVAAPVVGLALVMASRLPRWWPQRVNPDVLGLALILAGGVAAVIALAVVRRSPRSTRRTIASAALAVWGTLAIGGSMFSVLFLE